MKSKTKKLKDSVVKAADVLQFGGRAPESDLKEIANTNVAALLDVGLTLEQANTVLRMAAIEIARINNESLFIPKTPEIELKIKKGKKND